MNSFFAELSRRNVFRVAGMYAVIGWLLAQISVTLETALNLPDWFDTLIVSALLIGFPISLVVAWAFEVTPDGMKRTEAIDPESSITATTGRRLDVAIMAGLVLLVGLIGWQIASSGSSSSDGPIEAPSDAVQLASNQSIAVLPFANFSPDPDQDYFASGISEELLNALAQVPGLDVAGRTSSFAFKGDNRDLREIGDLLNVAHVLEGSVRKSGSTIRITAQLIKADDGYHMWSSTYDRELNDVFAVQDEITRAIVDELAVYLPALAEAGANLEPTATANIDAYDLFLLAKQKINYEGTIAAHEEAIALLDQSIALDDQYAPAWAWRAIADSALAELNDFVRPLEESIAITKRYADRAYALDPDSADSLAAMAMVHAWQKDRLDDDETTNRERDTAIAYLRDAVAARSNFSYAQFSLSALLDQRGDRAEAFDIIEEILAHDPANELANSRYVSTLLSQGRNDEALASLDRWERLSPALLAIQGRRIGILTGQGRSADALLAFEALDTSDEAFVWYQYLEYDIRHDLGDIEGIRRLIPTLGGRSVRQYYGRINIAFYERDYALAVQIAREAMAKSDLKRDGRLLVPFYYAGNQAELLEIYNQNFSTEAEAIETFGNYAPPEIVFSLRDAGHPHFALFRDLLREDLANDRYQFVENYWVQLDFGNLALYEEDYPTALAHFEQAIDLGWRDPFYTNYDHYIWIPDTPEWAAQVERMKALIDAERAKLGMDPL